jgi:hypothetical protein
MPFDMEASYPTINSHKQTQYLATGFMAKRDTSGRLPHPRGAALGGLSPSVTFRPSSAYPPAAAALDAVGQSSSGVTAAASAVTSTTTRRGGSFS